MTGRAVGGLGALQSGPEENLQALCDTKLFGQLRRTPALLPLRLAAKGRVVCIGSQRGSNAL